MIGDRPGCRTVAANMGFRRSQLWFTVSRHRHGLTSARLNSDEIREIIGGL